MRKITKLFKKWVNAMIEEVMTAKTEIFNDFSDTCVSNEKCLFMLEKYNLEKSNDVSIDIRIGIALLWAEYNNYTIPYKNLPISFDSLKIGDKFRVRQNGRYKVYTLYNYLNDGKTAIVKTRDRRLEMISTNTPIYSR